MSEQWYFEFNKKMNEEHAAKMKGNLDQSLATTQAILKSKETTMQRLRQDQETSSAAINQSYLDSQKSILALESDQAARHETAMLASSESHTNQMKAIEEMSNTSEGGQMMKQLLGGGIGFALGGLPGAAAGLAIANSGSK